MFMKWKIIILSVIVVVILAGLGAMIFCYNNIQYPVKYTNEINAASEEFGVQKELIASVINAESHYNEKAVSNKGAIGLMQIMPSTAEWILNKISKQNSSIQRLSQIELFDYEKSDGKLFDANLNIRIGTYYLAYLINKFKDVNTALCAYNAGEGKVGEWLNSNEFSEDKQTLKKIPYRETDNYVNKVNMNLKIYSKKLNFRWKKLLTSDFS